MTRIPDHNDNDHDQHSQDEQVILGVDTHADVHVAAVITVLGVLLGTRALPTTTAGYAALLHWARSHGQLRRAGVEGTSSHGVALNRFLAGNDVQVIEVNRPDRATRRRRGKTHALDAENAARAVLAGKATALAKSGDGVVEMLRLVKLAKDSAIKARTQAINQLRAVLARAEPGLRESLAGLGLTTLVRRCGELPEADMRDLGSTAAHIMRTLARRIHALEVEIRSHRQHLTTLIEDSAPDLLERPGIGADTAAALLITAGDNPDRLASEASFAALCGASPIEASSGKTTRHRLNRGGDRRANSALYTVVLTRLGRDQRTRDYAARRTTEGKSKRILFVV